MIKIVSLLHLKTTYYKEIDNDEYKKIYEDLLNKREEINETRLRKVEFQLFFLF